jgi:glycosyltransferase involved in cell wall biosynthesis
VLAHLRRPAEMTGSDLTWAIMAAGSREGAEQCAAARGVAPCPLVSKAEMLAGPLAFRRKLRASGIDALAVHSPSWSRQGSPHVYEAALALAPVRRRCIVDGETGDVRYLGGGELALGLTRLPLEVVRGLAVIGREVGAFQAARRRRPAIGEPRPTGDRPALVAIWHGLRGTEIGGAATHIAGILGGFRALGLRIGLVTTEPPPAELAAVIDDLELASPLPPAARMTGDIEALAINGPLRRAALALVRRTGPALIYQRHRAYLTAGVEVARATRSPLVLEWNNSEIWVRDNYERQMAVERLLDRVVDAMERYVVQAADLTAAVSAPAADMALAQGASAERVLVVPNGVDLGRIRRYVAEGGASRLGPDPVIGWIGTFGPWHGAEVLVRALPFLPPAARLLMIGDGELREPCESIARNLGVWDRIEWTGALPHVEAVRRLAGCDVLASPHVTMPNQRFFGSPTKLFEYMAIGRPIVASRLEQIGEVLEDGVTARLVPPGDARELANAIEQILSSPDRGEALARAGQREAEQHTWERRARTILARRERAPAGEVGLGAHEPAGAV